MGRWRPGHALTALCRAFRSVHGRLSVPALEPAFGRTLGLRLPASQPGVSAEAASGSWLAATTAELVQRRVRVEGDR